MLNTRDALELYVLLKDYIPENIPENLLEFTRELIFNIQSSDRRENFGRALLLMSKKSVMELEEIGNYGRIELFAEGLRENHFLNLITFCTTVGL